MACKTLCMYHTIIIAVFRSNLTDNGQRGAVLRRQIALDEEGPLLVEGSDLHFATFLQATLRQFSARFRDCVDEK
jgi:hypothetical protein